MTKLENDEPLTNNTYKYNIVRYYGTQKRTDYLGDISSGVAADFRHYNYRRVPYLGGSDEFK